MAFEITEYSCMTPICAGWQRQEVMQEVKLTEGMPDIGRTLGAWGQVILRSKQWNSDSMAVSAGIQAWVLYAPEDGTEPRAMEVWLPFQNTWQYPRQEREGSIAAAYRMMEMDARTLSARKLMVRMNVAAFGQALVPCEVGVPRCAELPEGVELLKNRYPLRMIREAGEKNFFMEEELNIGGNAQKLLRCQFEPVIAEERIMGQKLVFRGTGFLHGLFRNEEGKLFTKDMEIPFSQFSELDRDYGEDATGKVLCCVTSMETELAEGGILRLKCGITGQYQITNEEMVELPEDAYGLGREVEMKSEEIRVPCVLDQRQETVKWSAENWDGDTQVLDAAFCMDVPRSEKDGERTELLLSGKVLLMGYDSEGNLQCKTIPWEKRIPSSGEAAVVLPESLGGNRVGSMEGELRLWQRTMSKDAMPALVGLTIGEATERNPNRPSLILRKCRGETLWQLAKGSGSTVELICSANNLEREPDPDRMILIPVI